MGCVSALFILQRALVFPQEYFFLPFVCFSTNIMSFDCQRKYWQLQGFHVNSIGNQDSHYLLILLKLYQRLQWITWDLILIIQNDNVITKERVGFLWKGNFMACWVEADYAQYQDRYWIIILLLCKMNH